MSLCVGLISKIGLVSGVFCPAAFNIRSRLPDKSCSPATKHAGESVRRCVTLTSFTLSPRAFLIFSTRDFASFSIFFFSSFSFSSSSFPKSRSPFAIDCNFLPSNSLKVESNHSSTRSLSSKTSIPFFLKISKCGLCFAAS